MIVAAHPERKLEMGYKNTVKLVAEERYQRELPLLCADI
jgi:hypothetical protein